MTDKKLKIMLAITKSNFGGAQKYVHDIATNLPRDKFEVVVLFGGSGLLKNKLAAANIRTISLTSLNRDINIFAEISVFCSLLIILIKEKPDIFHVNSSKMAGLGTLAGRLTFTKKIIFTAHGWPFNESRSIFQTKLITFLSWLTIVFSHKTIAICQSDFKDTLNWPLIKNKIILIHNGISAFQTLERDLARNSLLPQKVAQKHQGDLWIGTIGELNKNYNFEETIKAVASFRHKGKQIFYIIIGAGEDKQKIEDEIKKLQAEDYIYLSGFMDNAGKYLKAFDCFLFTPKKAGLPYALLEAGQTALPVIATPVGGIPDLIKNKQTGILADGTEAVLIETAFHSSITDKEFQNYGQNLKKEVAINFSLQKMLEKTMATYFS